MKKDNFNKVFLTYIIALDIIILLNIYEILEKSKGYILDHIFTLIYLFIMIYPSIYALTSVNKIKHIKEIIEKFQQNSDKLIFITGIISFIYVFINILTDLAQNNIMISNLLIYITYLFMNTVFITSFNAIIKIKKKENKFNLFK